MNSLTLCPILAEAPAPRPKSRTEKGSARTDSLVNNRVCAKARARQRQQMEQALTVNGRTIVLLLFMSVYISETDGFSCTSLSCYMRTSGETLTSPLNFNVNTRVANFQTLGLDYFLYCRLSHGLFYI